jgi:hypothetical protein
MADRCAVSIRAGGRLSVEAASALNCVEPCSEMTTPMDTPSRSPITVVIADDHPMFREALRKLLETDPLVRVVGEAGNGRDAIC